MIKLTNILREIEIIPYISPEIVVELYESLIDEKGKKATTIVDRYYYKYPNKDRLYKDWFKSIPKGVLLQIYKELKTLENN